MLPYDTIQLYHNNPPCRIIISTAREAPRIEMLLIAPQDFVSGLPTLHVLFFLQFVCYWIRLFRHEIAALRCCGANQPRRARKLAQTAELLKNTDTGVKSPTHLEQLLLQDIVYFGDQ